MRNKHSTRPWQHVLEPLSGYLWLAANLALDTPVTSANTDQLCSAFNFGPSLSSNRTVADLVQGILKRTGGNWIDRSDSNAPHESSRLSLAIEKAFHLLGWKPALNFDETVAMTVDWYKAIQANEDAFNFTQKQIADYEIAAAVVGSEWKASFPVSRF